LELVLIGETANNNPAIFENLSATLQGPSAAHPLGTDELGRDELAHLQLGTRMSMLVALIILALATALGAAVLALGAAVASKRYAAVAHVFAVVSTPLLIVVLIAGTSMVDPQPPLPSRLNTFGLVIQEWAQPSAWGNDLTSAALLITLFLVGEVGRFGYLMFRSLPAKPRAAVSSLTPGKMPALTTMLGPAVVTGLWIAGDAVLVQNILAFYGIGDTPPFDPLSFMVSDGAGLQSTNPLLFFVPLVLVLLMVLSINVAGFGLRSALCDVPDQRSAR
jgi:peptide/nickel transport system permease protein